MPATPPPVEPEALNGQERRQLTVVRRYGTLGALLLAVASLGAGAAPVYNPVTGVPVLGLFARMPTVALACGFAGMAIIVISWLLLGRFARPGRERLMSKSQMDRTLIMWATPLALIPPLFSRDVYSYIAQGKITARGIDPYLLGAAQALGLADPLTRDIPNMWKETPAPYGPLFLQCARWFSEITSDSVVVSVLLHRGLELLGVAMIVWALPRLAKRFGAQPVSALWLGAVNPLVLFHLIAGAHNEALMIGFMMAGLELALRHVPVTRPGEKPDKPPPWQRGELLWLIIGAVVITLGAAVKISAMPALGFLGVIVARRWGATFAHLVKAAAFMIAISATVLVTASLVTGLGFGWTGQLGTPGLVRSWMAPVTGVGMLSGQLGVLLQLGNHTDAAIDVARLIGMALAAAICVRLLWRSFRGRLDPMIGLGLALGVVVALGATVLPWYLLWAVIPLSAAVGDNRFRTVAAGVCAFIALAQPPTGSGFLGHAFVLPQAYLGAAVVVALSLLVVNRTLPIRRRKAAQGDADRLSVRE
ncbi:alpha-1,6-mannosyltransferase [Herbihabitans rhizosphaerae]|uniref:Alpha-1,6-mannosyltransferase n=1 Tax=Herbihabitans rhizosphaerae TaxID=1872711 RepID=A0A4V2EU49_9PSEU|nr:alpha-1,6-mannosyltransferase [Herbihabitans rhizosphaerae]